jgi:phosphoglycolate phosphatase-like HAD superfamily hydrolase
VPVWRLWPVYLEALEVELEVRRAEGRIALLPGIAELLEILEGMAGISLGLLTGNIEEAAKLKLASAGVKTRFDICAYASDAEVRSEIARIALERSRSREEGAEPMAVVVGDTPEDIACARVMNAKSVAVATGRHRVEELEEAGADDVFSDFSDTEAVLSSILAPLTADGAHDGATGIGGTQ